jgi:hypothetical protein
MNDSLAGAGLLRMLFVVSGAASARVTRCDITWVSCNNTSAKCSSERRCMRRCDEKYIKCSGGSASLQLEQPTDLPELGRRRS